VQTPHSELTRTTLGVLFIGALIVATLWVLRPFIAPTIWATMIVVSSWPLMKWVQARLWNRRALAVTVMTLLILMLLVMPLMLAVTTIVRHVDDIAAKASEWSKLVNAPPPPWVEQLPVVGERIAQMWKEAAAAGTSELLGRLLPYADDIAKWFVAQAGSLGMVFVQFLLTAALAAVMYAGGETAVRALRGFGRRLAGVQGDRVVTLAGGAIRGVALGVGITALLQAGLGGIGLAIAGVPFASLLTAVMLLLCIAQLGPGLVLVPAVVWVFWSGETGWGVFLLVWTLVVTTMDNFVRPALIRLGADLPLLLIFGGVIGGLLAFGLIGIFVGPVVLAVSYTLLDAWINDGAMPSGGDPEAAPPGAG
jgi:predicted PurR-regulated permease PerM